MHACPGYHGVEVGGLWWPPEARAAQPEGVKIGEVGPISGVGCVDQVAVVEHLLKALQGMDVKVLGDGGGLGGTEAQVLKGGDQGSRNGTAPA